MAEVLAEMPGERRVRHSWREWADGRVWKLTHGVDFASRVTTMHSGAHAWAKRNGYTVAASIPDERTLIVQFTKLEGQE